MERWNRSTNANDNTLSFASAFLFSHLFPRSRNPVTTEREKYPEQKNHKERCQFNSIPSKVNQIPKPYIISIMYNICDRSESNKNFQLYILVLFLYLSSISLPAFSSRFFFFSQIFFARCNFHVLVHITIAVLERTPCAARTHIRVTIQSCMNRITFQNRCNFVDVGFNTLKINLQLFVTYLISPEFHWNYYKTKNGSFLPAYCPNKKNAPMCKSTSPNPFLLRRFAPFSSRDAFLSRRPVFTALLAPSGEKPLPPRRS